MGYKTIANEAGITQRAVAKQRKRGVPEKQIVAGAKAREIVREIRAQFDTISDAEYIQAVRRKALADAEKTERDNSEKAKILIDGAIVKQAWSDHIGRARSSFLAIGEELADKLATMADPVRIRELIGKKVREVLTDLSHYEGV